MEDVNKLVWKIDNSFKQKLTLEEAKIIYNEAEKAFNDTIDASVRILDRISSLLQIVAGILVGLVAYSIGKWEVTKQLDAVLVTALIAIGYYLCLGLIFIFPNIKPNEYILPGTQPRKLFVKTIFDIPTEYRELLLYMTNITNLQEGIDFNRSINNKRWEIYKISLNILFYSPIVLIIIYLISYKISVR